jgi:hypothetical protein
MGERLKNGGNVVMLRGAPGHVVAEIRGNAFRKQLADKYPSVKVLGEQYSGRHCRRFAADGRLSCRPIQAVSSGSLYQRARTSNGGGIRRAGQ